MSDKKQMTQRELVDVIITRASLSRMGGGIPQSEVIKVGGYINFLHSELERLERERTAAVSAVDQRDETIIERNKAIIRLDRKNYLMEAAVKAALRQNEDGVWECECGGNDSCDWCVALNELDSLERADEHE